MNRDSKIHGNWVRNVAIDERDERGVVGAEVLAIETQELAHVDGPVPGVDAQVCRRCERAACFAIERLLQVLGGERPARKDRAAHGAAIQREMGAGIAHLANHIVFVAVQGELTAPDHEFPKDEEDELVPAGVGPRNS